MRSSGNAGLGKGAEPVSDVAAGLKIWETNCTPKSWGRQRSSAADQRSSEDLKTLLLNARIALDDDLFASRGLHFRQQNAIP
jgi:hypothetical protein